MILLELFNNISDYSGTPVNFSESLLESLFYLEYEESGLVLKQIIEESYTDGIDGFENVENDGNKITGIFFDKVSSGLIKRYQFEVTEDEVSYKLLNPEDLDGADFAELEFAMATGTKAQPKKKNCVNGTSCGATCINKDKKCSSENSSASKKKVKGLLEKTPKVPKTTKVTEGKKEKKIEVNATKKPKERETQKNNTPKTKKTDTERRSKLTKTNTENAEKKINEQIKSIRENDIAKNPGLKDYWNNKIKELEDIKARLNDLKTHDHSNHKIPDSFSNFSTNVSEQKAYLARIELTPKVSTARTALSHARNMQKTGDLPTNMSIAEAASIANYTRQSYETDNLYLRSNNNSETIYQKQEKTPKVLVEHPREKDHLEEDTIANIRMIASALDKLPNYDGTVYRGTTSKSGLSPELIEQTYKPGNVIEEKGFTSTSYAEDGQFSGNVQYIIKSKTGKKIEDFSNYRNEKEVLFKPRTKFRVTKFLKNGDNFTINMEEV